MRYFFVFFWGGWGQNNQMWHEETQEEADREHRAKAERIREAEELGRRSRAAHKSCGQQFPDYFTSILTDAVPARHWQVTQSVGSYQQSQLLELQASAAGRGEALKHWPSLFPQPPRSDRHLWNAAFVFWLRRKFCLFISGEELVLVSCTFIASRILSSVSNCG